MREHEVAIQIALGKTNREIADELIVSERTIETHVSHILSKLGFAARAQVAAWVKEQRLLNAGEQ
jgi:DNA-binding NarL/FixJ family response regulator